MRAQCGAMVWTAAELMELAAAIRSLPDSVAKRGILQRLDREEIDVRTAINELRRIGVDTSSKSGVD